MNIFLYVPLILCLVGCSKDSKTSDKGGAAKDQKVKTEPLPDFPDPMTKEFIMAMWEAPHNVEGIIPEMEKVRLKEGVWKVERKIGPNKNELEDVPATSMTLKFTKRRFHIWKFSFEDFVQFSLMTFDYGKKSYRWWYLMPDDFIGENSGNIAEGENFIWESVVRPEENGEGVKMKSVEDLSLRKTNEDPVTIEIQMLRKDEIIWVAEDTLTWASELLKEGQIKSKETSQSEVISSPLEKNKLDKVIKTGEKARVKSDLGEIEIGLLNYKISARSYPTTEQGLSALIKKPSDVRAWEGPYFKEGPINDPWGNEYGYRFPSQKGQDAPDIFSKGADGQENTEDDIGNWEAEEDNSKGVFEEGGLEEMLRSEGDREKLLRSNIVGKAFSLKSPDVDRIGKFIFGEDGKISLNADGVIIPVGSYAVDGLKVKVFEGGRQNGGLEFYSLNPKVGDQVSMIDETNVKLSIVKIESANKVVADPKKQKTFANQAKRAEAMNEVTQLKNAISVYELEYAKLPFQARNAGDADLRMDTFKDNLISVLSGYNIDGLNPRKQAFYQGKRARGRDSQKPTSGVFGADEKLKLADPWGNAYSIVFDSNYDLTLKGLPGTEGKEVRASVAVWSTGGADDQKKFDPEKWIKSW